VANERILVIDDSPDIREFLAHTILAGAGYDVLTATNGREGLVLVRDLNPDLIISDYLMPEMTGLEMLEALKGAGLDIPMILITAEGSEILAVEALRAGVRDYLIKPIDSDVLLRTVESVMKRYWASQIKERIPAYLLEANLKLEKRYRELSALVNIGTSVTAMLDIQQVLNRVVEAAVSVTNAEEGSLMLIDRSTGELYMRAARNLDQRTVSTLRLKMQDSLVNQIMTSGQPLILNEEEAVKIKTAYLVKSIIYVPLRVTGKVIGVLNVDSRSEVRSFDSHDAQVLSVLADFAAVAIENARLHAETIQERDTLDAILRDTDDHVIVVSADDRVLFCNPTARDAFKVTMTDFIGKPINDVIQDPEVLALFSKDAQNGRGRRSEIVLNGGERVLNAQLTIIEGVGRAVVMQDITHLKQLDRAKSDFVATVAHDLRSPLTAVLGYAELLQRAGSLNEQQQKFVEQIITSVHSITLLITELLELSRIEAGFNIDLEPVNMGQVVRQSIESLAHQLTTKGHTLNVSVPAELPMIQGNPLRLRQMITNLVGNAIKYTPDHGQINIALWPEEDLVVFQVSDNGIGIPAEDQPYVFDKFFRSERAVNDFEGTGLGLSIVKGIVEQHSGRIWLESKENEGTKFTVVLPQNQSQSERTARHEPA
jgi:signal transduction histidine kinase/DNA-binding response OmpR family regulator